MDILSATAAKLIGSIQSPAGQRGKLSILIYHRVLTQHDPMRPYEVDADAFSWQMETLAGSFNVLPLAKAVEHLRDGTLPARAACVTFDDGYADNLHVARPILQKWGIPATVFVATGYLNGGRMWNDSVIEALRQVQGTMLKSDTLDIEPIPIETFEQRRAAAQDILNRLKYLDEPSRAERTQELIDELGVRLPRDLMMTDADVRALADSGIDIGAHTANHPILTSLEIDDARAEIETGKHYLENLLQREVERFAYPNGRRGRDYSAEHVELVRRIGFSAALSTDHGVSRHGDSGFELRRFTPWDRTPRRFLARLLLNLRVSDQAGELVSPQPAAIKGQ